MFQVRVRVNDKYPHQSEYAICIDDDYSSKTQYLTIQDAVKLKKALQAAIDKAIGED